MSLAEWVRQALQSARHQELGGDMSQKLESIRLAVRHEYPSADIDRMLAEIEAGSTLFRYDSDTVRGDRSLLG
jgi:hypothetical protein